MQSFFQHASWEEVFRRLGGEDGPRFLDTMRHELFVGLEELTNSFISSWMDNGWVALHEVFSTYLIKDAYLEAAMDAFEHAFVEVVRVEGAHAAPASEEEYEQTQACMIQVFAMFLEAARTPLTWSDLTSREHEVIEPAFFQALTGQSTQHVFLLSKFLPSPGNSLPLSLRLIVLYFRNNGEPPTWFVRYVGELEALSVE